MQRHWTVADRVTFQDANARGAWGTWQDSVCEGLLNLFIVSKLIYIS